MTEIFDKAINYLEAFIPNFQTAKIGSQKTFTCPKCLQDPPTCYPMASNVDYFCRHCGMVVGTLLDFVRHLEPEKSEYTDDQVLKYLGDYFNIPVITQSDIDNMLEYYLRSGFDLVPIKKDDKLPIEQGWPTKSHRDVEEWKKWLELDLNIGVKTGKISGITILDIDSKNIPPELAIHLIDYKGFCQESSKGFHYAYKLADLPNSPFNIIIDPNDRTKDVHCDLKNDGGQIVIFPSVVEGKERKIISSEEIPVMPEELRKYILSQINNPKEKFEKKTKLTNDLDPKLLDSLETEGLGIITSGNRNNFLTSFGGILRKELNIEQTGYVLDIVNNKFLDPPLPQRELSTIVGSLNKYIKFDEKDLAGKILSYLKVVGEANARDVKEVVNEKKEDVDKALAYLIKEGFIIKVRRMYQAIRKADWREDLVSVVREVPFKVPYFHDIAHFCNGDLILLGGKNKSGKTTLAMNVVKKLVEQGIKPYYFGLEAGSRFTKTALQMGLKEGDFKWTLAADPTKIEFEPNAVTIIDWLFVEDFSQTNVILKHFVDQLFKTNGFLIVFAQLKTDGSWFAPNLITNFPAFAARYSYLDDNDGTYGKWTVDAIRDPKLKVKKAEVNCVYDWDKKTLTRVDEIMN